MKKQIKSLFIMVILLLTISMVYGQGEKESTEIDTISYIHLGDWAKPILENAAQDFFAETGVEVEMQFWPWDGAREKYVTLISSDSLADCGQGYQEWLGEFVARRAVVPVEDYISDEFKKKILPSALENLTYNGKLYANPFITSIRSFLYRKDVFEAKGVPEPETFDDILKAASMVFNPPEMYGYGMSAGRNKYTTQFFLYIFWPYGGKLLNDDGKTVAFNSEAGIAAMEMFKKLSVYAPEGYINADGQLSEGVFTSGNLAMMIEGPWVYNQLLATVPEAEIGVVPSIQGPDGGRGNLYVVDALYLFNEETASICQDWFEFYKSDEQYLGQAYNDFGLIPDMTVHMDWEFMQSNELVKMYAPAVAYGKSRPMIPQWSQIEDILNIAIQKVCLGVLSPVDALAEAEKNANEALKNN